MKRSERSFIGGIEIIGFLAACAFMRFVRRERSEKSAALSPQENNFDIARNRDSRHLIVIDDPRFRPLTEHDLRVLDAAEAKRERRRLRNIRNYQREMAAKARYGQPKDVVYFLAA